MINLIKKNNCDGIIAKSANVSEAYEKYLDNRLFYAIGKQKLFCPECGGVDLDPRNFEEIKFCPKCGNDKGFAWQWNTPVISNTSIDILVNTEIPTISVAIIMLEKIAKKRGVNINWHYKVGDEIMKI